MSRTAILATIHAARSFEEWATAVRQLGRWRRAQDAPPVAARRDTGLTRTQLYQQMLKSHHFDYDRPHWATLNPWASAAEFDALKTELAARAKAERAAKKAPAHA